MATVFRIGRFAFPYAGRPRDMWRGALAGLVLFGTAGAAMSFSRGVAAYGLEGDAVGATVTERWEQTWPGGVLIGMVAGALLGATAAFLAGAAFEERGSAWAVIAVGLLGGIAAAAAWGSSAARHRVVTIRAEPPGAPPPVARPTPPGPWRLTFSVNNSTIRVEGDVEHRLDKPMLAFMILAGAAVGGLAARGLVGDWPRDERFARPHERAFAVTPVRPAAAEPVTTPPKPSA